MNLNLSAVLDIAIGLTFIYLILSLLASEIQELIATLLQWRAAHLKNSIENLLIGSEAPTESLEEVRVKKIVNDLYNNPLIKNINQEAKEGVAALLRQGTWILGDAYRSILGISKPTFGEIPTNTNTYETEILNKRRSAPSYIPAETFATTMMETLKIPTLVQKFSEVKVEAFKQYLLNEIEALLTKRFIPPICGLTENISKTEGELKNSPIGEPAGSLLEEFNKLKKAYNQIINDFKDNKATLEITIDRMEAKLNKYILGSTLYLRNIANAEQTFTRRMDSLKEDFGENERDVLLRGMKPSLTQVVDALDTNSEVHQQITETYRQILEAIKDKNSPSYKKIADELEIIEKGFQSLPKSVKESISALAHRAQSRVEITETDINQLRQEIELWYDRSMERASGVYKRNAKGVAVLIGFVIAVAANADTFQMATRLSKDSVLRAAVTNYAQEAVSNCPNSQPQNESLDCIRQQINPALTDINLPIGWNFGQPQGGVKWRFSTITDALAVLKKLLGWLVTGFAVSMGATFWFDLLGKVVNVRNAGSKPPSSANNQPDFNDQTTSTQTAHAQTASTRSERSS